MGAEVNSDDLKETPLLPPAIFAKGETAENRTEAAAKQEPNHTRKRGICSPNN